MAAATAAACAAAVNATASAASSPRAAKNSSSELLDSPVQAKLALAELAQADDPVSVAARLSPCALRVQLHGLRGLRAKGGMDDLAAAPPSSSHKQQESATVGGGKSSSSNNNNISSSSSNVESRPRATSLLLRYGRLSLEYPLPQQRDGSASSSGFDVPIGEEAVIPLAPALLAGNRLARPMKQLHDIKFSVKAGDVTLAKMQIPMSDVPQAPAPEPSVGAATAVEEPCEFARDSRLWLEKNGGPASCDSPRCDSPRCQTPTAGDAAEHGGSFRIPACRSEGSFLGGRGLSFMRSSSPTEMTKRLRSVLSVEAVAPSPPKWVPIRCPSPTSATAAAAASGDSTKLYRRVMEPRVPLAGPEPVEIAVSLSLEALPTKQERMEVGSSASGIIAGDKADAEESPDKPFLASPPPALATPLVDVDVDMDVEKLFSNLFSNSSGFMTKHWSTEGLRDFEVTPWTEADNLGLGSRSLAYVKPLRIPIPLAPKQCNVWEKQSILSKSDEGFVVLCQSSNDAPKGDCFHVLVQLYGVRLSAGRSWLRITMEMVFTKSCLGRGMIQQGAEADARRSWRALVDSLRQSAESVYQRDLSSLSSTSILSSAAAVAAELDAAVQPSQSHYYKTAYKIVTYISSFANHALPAFITSMQFERVLAVAQLLCLLAILAAVCLIGFRIDRRLSMLEQSCLV